MASNYTSNYGLCQWEATDAVLRTDFNEDNEKIDAALKSQADSISSLKKQVGNKANSSAVSSLSTKLDQEIQERTEELTAEAAARVAGLALKGNVQVEIHTYVGNGTSGSTNPNSITFSKQPLLFFITGKSQYSAYYSRGNDIMRIHIGTVVNSITCSWTGSVCSWYGQDSYTQFNARNITYTVVALLAADE